MNNSKIAICLLNVLILGALASCGKTSPRWDAESPSWKAKVSAAQWVRRFPRNPLESDSPINLKVDLEMVSAKEGQDADKAIEQFLRAATDGNHSATLNGTPLKFIS